LTELEAVNDPTLSAQSFQAVLPSSTSIGEFWPESQQIIALPHELQKTVSSHVGAIYVVFNLLLSLANAGHWRRGKSTTFVAYDHHQPWILDTCLALWKHFERWTITPVKRPLQDETVALYIQLLEAVALPTEQLADCPPGAQKAAQTLLAGLSGLLNDTSLSNTNQLRLASVLIRLQSSVNGLSNAGAGNGRGRRNPTLTVVETLEANIARICRDADRFLTLSKDLQVSASRSLLSLVLTMVSQRYASGLRLVHGRRRLPMHVTRYAKMPPRASRIINCLKRPVQYSRAFGC
jgi:serine/threonine-protein kinase ATR